MYIVGEGEFALLVQVSVYCGLWCLCIVGEVNVHCR